MFLRLAIIGVLLIPSLVIGVLYLQGIPLQHEVVVSTVASSVIAMLLWLVILLRQRQMDRFARHVLIQLENDNETTEALVEPFQLDTCNEPTYLAMEALAERVALRREQLKTNFDKLSGLLITLSQNKPVEVGTYDFDLPDSDDRTLLLGSLCQLIHSLNHSKQRGDVFANVLRESPIAMIITCSEYRIRSMNPAAEKLLGITLQQATQKLLLKFFVPPPLKSHHAHLKGIVVTITEALAALQGGRQEVFSTVCDMEGKVKLVGLRASFGNHCLFMLREKIKDHGQNDNTIPDTITLDLNQPHLKVPAILAG
jgi:PAS domain-containing protein